MTLGRLLKGGFRKNQKKYVYRQYEGELTALHECMNRITSAEVLYSSLLCAMEIATRGDCKNQA